MDFFAHFSKVSNNSMARSNTVLAQLYQFSDSLHQKLCSQCDLTQLTQ